MKRWKPVCLSDSRGPHPLNLYDSQHALMGLSCQSTAGLPLEKVAGSNTSVFAGAFFHDYSDSMVRDEENLPRFWITGTGSAMASNRISHFFDFRGASMTLNTGCSTTLVALHQAVQSLRMGECDMSVVGGSNVLLNPDVFKSMGSLG